VFEGILDRAATVIGKKILVRKTEFNETAWSRARYYVDLRENTLRVAEYTRFHFRLEYTEISQSFPVFPYS
jgi:hypothetical protein